MSFFNVTRIPHPFSTTKKSSFVMPEEVEREPDVVSTTWGMTKVVNAKHVSGDMSEEWSVEKDNVVRLKSVEIDIYDKHVIRTKRLNLANYRLVKPYVIAGTYTNGEIATILNASKSWVERLTPRIKEAIKERRKNTPIFK